MCHCTRTFLHDSLKNGISSFHFAELMAMICEQHVPDTHHKDYDVIVICSNLLYLPEQDTWGSAEGFIANQCLSVLDYFFFHNYTFSVKAKWSIQA